MLSAKSPQRICTFFRMEKLHHVIGSRQMHHGEISQPIPQKSFLTVAGNLTRSRIKPQNRRPDIWQE